MLASSFLDTAIGIIFVFLLLSLIASTINEIVLSTLSMRGRFLLRGLKTLLNDANATGLVSEIYNHGQIFGLFRGTFNPQKPGNLPSYIPSRNFVMAFLGVIPETPVAIAAARQEAAAQLSTDAEAVAAKDPGDQNAAKRAEQLGAEAEKAKQDKAAAEQTAKDAKTALENISSAASEVQLTAAFQSFKQVAQDLAKNPQTEKVGKPLVEMINEAGTDIKKLKYSLGAWYDSAMDRVSGWYKYHTQWILVWIGLALAAGLNADTIVIVQQLSSNATLRQSVVAAAQAAKSPSDSSKPATISEVKEQVQKIDELGIPLGWKRSWPSTRQDWVTWLVLFLRGFPGFLLTAVAVSLGAPFWFDILNKIMVVRSTVKPHEKSKEEGTKDKPSK
jgi:hypothetical protein